MTQPYIAQVIVLGCNFAPRNYAFCNGQLQAISQNEALFALVGTTYGGDGVTTFALPNIQERTVVNWGQGLGLSNYDLGQTGGAASVTLLQSQIPQHNHLVTAFAGTTYDKTATAGGWIGNESVGGRLFSATNAPDKTFAQSVMVDTGGSQPHENRQPFLTMNYCIALFGIFPSRN